jgi:hypothetical protein
MDLVKPGYFLKISCMEAGAALLAMLDILLCHAQQLQLFFFFGKSWI